jgi:hypothetical protein
MNNEKPTPTKEKNMNNLLGTLATMCVTRKAEAAKKRQGMANTYPAEEAFMPNSTSTIDKKL